MTVATQARDPETIRRTLEEWISTEWPGADVSIAELSPFGTGASSETYSFHLAGGMVEPTEYVVRTAPVGLGIFRDYDLAEQVRILNALGKSGAIVPFPVACASGTTRDDTLMIMPLVHGDIPPSTASPYTKSGWVVDLTPERQRHLVESFTDAMADMHRIDPTVDGLVSGVLGKRPGLVGEFQWWDDYFAGVRMGMPAELVEPIEEANEWCRATMPSGDVRPSVIWGDSRFGNVIFDDEQNVAALLDWEMAGIGPAEVDLGYHLAHRYNSGFLAGRDSLVDLDLDGAPSKAEQVARYEARLGREVQDLPWYEAFGGTRLAMMHLALRRIFLNSDTPVWKLPPPVPSWLALKMREYTDMRSTTPRKVL